MHMKGLLINTAIWAVVALLIPGSVVAENSNSSSPAMELGQIGLRVIGPKEYGAYPQVFDIAQDKRGMIFVGNGEGLLAYNGTSWKLHRLPNNEHVRSVSIDPRGNVVVGARGVIGYFPPTPSGIGEFQAFEEQLGEHAAEIGEIWYVTPAVHETFFFSAKKAYALNQEDTLVAVEPPKTVYSAFAVKDSLVVKYQGAGLALWNGESFQELPGTEALDDMVIFDIVPLRSGKWMLISHHDGLKLYDPETGELKTPQGAQYSYVTEQMPYLGTELYDGTIAVSTLSGKLLFVSESGELLRAVKVSDYRLGDVMLGRQGEIWISAGSEIVVMDWPSPMTYFSADEGLRGFVQSVVRHKGSLYVGTTVGLYTMEPGDGIHTTAKFVNTGWSKTEVWDMQSVDDVLYFVNVAGLHVVREESPVLLFSELYPLHIEPSRLKYGRYYLPSEDGLGIFEVSEDQVTSAWKVSGYSQLSNSLVELDESTVLVGGFGNGVRALILEDEGRTVTEIQPLGGLGGLPPGSGQEQIVYRVGNRIVATNESSVFSWNDDIAQFQQESIFDVLEQDQNRYGYLLHSGPDGRVWTVGSQLGVAAVLGESLEWRALKYQQRPGELVFTILPEADGVVWLGTSSGLIRYDSLIRGKPSPALHVVMSQFQTGPANQVDYVDPAIPLRQFPVTVRASLLSHLLAESPQYQWRMLRQGAPEAEFSDWSESGAFSANPQLAGDYVLEIRGRAGDTQSELTSYPFRITEPWYQKREIWALAILISIFFIALLVLRYSAWRQRRLRQRYEQLMQVVDERTDALNETTVQLRSAQEKLNNQTRIDGLTGVANRLRMDEHLQRCVQMAARESRPVSLMMVDIDRFKAFNEEYGHLRGDDCLRIVATELQTIAARPMDLVARYGGEEFLVFLYDTPMAAARSLAEAVRKRIEARFASSDVLCPLTISLGVCAVIPLNYTEPARLVAIADKALYEAKSRGRNQIITLESAD